MSAEDPSRSPAQSVGAEEPLHPQPPTPLPDEAEKKPRSELALRLGTAAILIPSVIWLIVNGGLPYLVAIVVIVLLGLREFYRMIAAKGAEPLQQAGYAAGAALPVVAFVGNEYHATILMTAVLLALLIAQLGKAQIRDALASISGTFFGVFYVGWLMSHAIVLRGFHDVVRSKWGLAVAEGMDPNVGIFLMLFVVVAVVACDVGAYFAGRAYGRRKLAPRISPKKTVEGALGGILVGTLGGFTVKLIFDLFWPSLSSVIDWTVAGVLGVVVSVAGIVGDLVESLLKRDAQQKDTGQLLPGMGGMLDRIDSNLMGIPVMYYLMLAYTYVQAGQGWAQ